MKAQRYISRIDVHRAQAAALLFSPVAVAPMSNVRVGVPPSTSALSQRSARTQLGQQFVKGGPFTSMPVSDGPRRFVDWSVNPLTVHKLKIVDVDSDGYGSQREIIEHDYLFAVEMDRPDFPERTVAMNVQQMNTLLSVMRRVALEYYAEIEGKNDTRGLSERKIQRLVADTSTEKYEALKFLSVRFIATTFRFLGVQWGNKFVSPEAGPGVAVVDSGSIVARNICVNHPTHEQDELWFILRRRTANGPLQVVLQSFARTGGPRLPDRTFSDEAGCDAVGATWRVGTLASKDNPDQQEKSFRLTAAGLQGTTSEIYIRNANAPTFRIVLGTAGIKAMQT